MMKYLFLIAIFFYFIACDDQNPKTSVIAESAVQIDSLPAQCPYLTKDARGNTVLSWVRMVNDSLTAFCFATSTDGKKFSSPVVIPNTNNIQPHGENLPKIIFKPSGEIIALWGAGNPNPKNKYSGLVYYTQSFDNGKTWTTAKRLVRDTTSFDQRYYDVALLPNGEAGIIWLDNRNIPGKEGSLLCFASTEGNQGFQDGKVIAESCCQCCRTDLYIDKNAGIHALFRGIIQDSIRDMVHTVSNDGGNTFSTPQRISEDNWVIKGCPHTGPAMTENKDGIHFAWFTGGKNRGCYYTKSTDNGKSFISQDSVSSSGSHPQLASLSSDELVIVWDEPHEENNKVYKRIGIQRRSKEGRDEGKTYITSSDSNASYPVIAPTNDNSAIVAYSKKESDKSYVAYKVIRVD